MEKILIVKTSSMGDVIHNLPIVADIITAMPNAVIDWVVEENFADLPALHPNVHDVIPVAWRRWRKSLFSWETWSEMRDFHYHLTRTHYDCVIDTQGLLKSGVIVKMAQAVRKCGYAKEVAREPFAARFYQDTYAIPRNAHAVERNRWLAGSALGYYPNEHRLDYGLSAPASIENASQPYAILLHATSRADKQWPQDHWVKLGRQLNGEGLKVLLPWGNEEEHDQALMIADELPNATVLPRQSLKEMAAWMAHSKLTVGVDTGLLHLSAAFDRPTIGLYLSTSPELTGVYANKRGINLGGIGEVPSVEVVAKAAQKLLQDTFSYG